MLRLVVLLLAVPGFTWASSEFVGRWDISEKIDGREYASWMEITSEGSGFTGRVVPRGGHARPAKVTIKDGELHVVVEPYRPGSGSGKSDTYIGRAENGGLKGTGKDSRDRDKVWRAVRAPDRLQGSDRKVEWGEPVKLFNGRDTSGWDVIGSRRPSKWKAVGAVLANEDTGANIRTAREFRDFKLHLEYKVPKGSNSGVYLRGRYETQVIDGYGREPYSRGNGGVYGFITPTVEASKPPGEWNTLEVTLVGYRVTIVLNGQTTIDGKLIDGVTGGALDSHEDQPGPIMLQGDHGPVYYRNIVLTPAK